MSTKIFLCFALLAAPLMADDLGAVTQLIEATSAKLAVQQTLLADMEEFAALKEQFMQGQEVKKVGYQMVQAAVKILDTLEREHLKEVISKPYLEELQFFTTLAKKP